MYLVDANILVYAFRKDAPEHEAVGRWLYPALAGRVPVGTSPLVELSLLRLMTHPGPGKGVTIERLFEFLADLHGRPAAIRLFPADRHAGLFESLCRRHAIRGNDVYDAWLAALALEHHATLVTRDRGFARFTDLPTFDPVAAIGLHESPAAYAAKRLRVTRSARP